MGYGLSYCFSRGHHSCHAAINDVMKLYIGVTKIPGHLEPTGLYRSDGQEVRWSNHHFLEEQEDTGIGCYLLRHSGIFLHLCCCEHNRSGGGGGGEKEES